MNKSVEELLKKRVKLIEPYPGCTFDIGVIFIQINNKSSFYEPINSSVTDLVRYPDKYPVNFKVLEWWEDRDIEDMPEYVKTIEDKSINYLVYQINGYNFKEDTILITNAKGEKNCPLSLKYFIKNTLPATLEEYNQYIQSKK